MGEDCLCLNVWTPSINDNARRPVMFWLHEGGFQRGSSQEHTWYDGTNLARRDVVVVSINHRLNVFGFLNLASFSDEYRDSANVGLLDIVAALRWVRDNIGRFGGDPSNVTVFGQSGGGAKLNYLMAMPAAKGLFHKAIAQSPIPVITSWDTPEESAKYAGAMIGALGLSRERINEIRTLPYQVVAQAAIKAAQADPSVGGLPTVDGVHVPEPPFGHSAPQISADIPLMLGSTMREGGPILRPDLAAMDEAALNKRTSERYGAHAAEIVAAVKAAYPAAELIDVWAQIDFERVRRAVVLQAERKAAQSAAPVYLYLFAWRTEVLGGMPRAFHGSDVPFVFDNTEESSPYTGGTVEARALADRMSGAWVRFARTGNPNHSGLPSWAPVTAGTKPTMIFDTLCEVKVNHDEKARQLMAPA
jgi:para-nitrobenzyl esterase